MPEIIDSHCHLDLEAFDSDRMSVIARACSAGVTDFIVPAVAADRWQGLQQLQHEHAEVHIALGLHPYFIDQHATADLRSLEQLLQQSPAIAVGEIGLDYQDRSLDRQQQQYFFQNQLQIAADAGLPVIIHARKSHDDVIACIKRSGLQHGGIMHAFNGSLQQAEKLIDMGFRLGFGGMLTFERSHKLRRLAANLPLDALVMETDAPDMSGAAHRGQRNSPEYLPEVLQALSEIRQSSPDEIARQTTWNVRELFGLG